MAPPEMSSHGAHSGAVIVRPKPPASGTTTAESMNSSSMPSSVANIPIARNILFHMMVPETGILLLRDEPLAIASVESSTHSGTGLEKPLALGNLERL